MSDGTRFHVALYAGVYVWRDAVSSSLAAKLDVVRRLIEMGAPIDVTVFTQGSDRDDPAVLDKQMVYAGILDWVKQLSLARDQ